MPDPDWQQVSGLWAAPRVDSTAEQQVHLHVSIAVGAIGELADEEVDAALVAGGEFLQQLSRPGGEEPLDYLQLRSTAAVGQFAFANPSDLTPERVDVTVRGDTVSFPLSPTGDLPVA